MSDYPDRRTCACCLIEFDMSGGVLLPVRDGWGLTWLCHGCRPEGNFVDADYWCDRCYPKDDAR